jgi:hypothetical protein
MLFVWAVFINPINVRVRASTSESFPADWASLRDRWHRFACNPRDIRCGWSHRTDLGSAAGLR